MADPAMAGARAVAERTNEPLHGLDPERIPAPGRHLIRNGSGSIGYRLGGKRRSALTIQRLIAQADEYAKRVQALEAENHRLGNRLALLEPEENFALLSTLADAVEQLNGAMRRLSDTHRIVLKALANEVSR